MGILPQLILNSLIAGAVYTLIALGFNLIYGVTRFFNIAHGALAAVGGYAVFFFSKTLGWNLYGGVILGVVIAGLIGYISDLLVYAPLRRRKASPMVQLVASLGIFTVIQAVIAILFTSQFQTLSSSQNLGTQHIYSIGGGVITETQVVILLTGLMIMLGLTALMKYTAFGKQVKAVSDDEEVASIIGINTHRMTGYIFFIGSAIAGLAGILVGYDTGIEPTMGMNLLLKGVIAAIVGGVGSVVGGVLGSFLLGFVENFGIWKIAGEWKDAIAFGLLILFLIFRPHGIIKR